MPTRRFRVVGSIQNTKKIVVAGGTLESDPTILDIYQFDASNSGIVNAPGERAYHINVGSGTTPEAIFNLAISLESQHLEGYPTQAPYQTQVLGGFLSNPNKVLAKEEIYNLLPKESIPESEVEDLVKEMFPPVY
jgi:hypothetical protein